MFKRMSLSLMILLGVACTTPEPPDNRLPTCEKNLAEMQSKVANLEAANASLKKTIETNEASYAKSLNQICAEGLAKVETVWETSRVVVDAKTFTALPCSPNHTVKMGVIDSKRKITALQIRHSGGTFSASRPFNWTSEVDRWHVLSPKTLLEVESCGPSTCQMICHARIEKAAALPSCIP